MVRSCCLIKLAVSFLIRQIGNRSIIKDMCPCPPHTGQAVCVGAGQVASRARRRSPGGMLHSLGGKMQNVAICLLRWKEV